MSRIKNILEQGSSLHSYYDLSRVKAEMKEEQAIWKKTTYKGSLGEINSSYIDGGKEFMFADYHQEISCDTLIKTEVGQHTCLEMTFMLEMDELTDQINGEQNTYRAMQQNIHYIAPGSETELYCRSGKKYRNFDVYMDLSTLQEWKLDYAPLDALINAVQLGKSATLFKESIPVTASTKRILKEISSSGMTGIAREIYMKGKVFELLAHQINFVTQKIKVPEEKVRSNFRMGEYDINVIEKIARFIEGNTEPFTTIKDFSRRYGINEHKLKNGFKAHFGKPIFEYAQDLRMLKAKEMLQSSQKPIKEIAYEIGYKTPVAFTEAFKKYHDMLPKEIRMMM
ncbi:helix-turn-helix domain-containing protein [Pedobacter caeni]|uniref:AraC-type DNA-binding protein n=1 Tax=Pedobacter caeni TaxID=288992 RepID=A0A1M5A5B7_9SPHI|nr:AraC family transcriptional regulator [Pedobacter caeni]SHF25022.1 AraC-type DNA-binding protein [Pedobacter caeni]